MYVNSTCLILLKPKNPGLIKSKTNLKKFLKNFEETFKKSTVFHMPSGNLLFCQAFILIFLFFFFEHPFPYKKNTVIPVILSI